MAGANVGLSSRWIDIGPRILQHERLGSLSSKYQHLVGADGNGSYRARIDEVLILDQELGPLRIANGCLNTSLKCTRIEVAN